MLIAVALVGIAVVSVNVAWLHPVTTALVVHTWPAGSPTDESTTFVTTSAVLTPATT
jgi:hypothetical protein